VGGEMKWFAWPKYDRQKMNSKNMCMKIYLVVFV